MRRVAKKRIANGSGEYGIRQVSEGEKSKKARMLRGGAADGIGGVEVGGVDRREDGEWSQLLRPLNCS